MGIADRYVVRPFYKGIIGNLIPMCGVVDTNARQVRFGEKMVALNSGPRSVRRWIKQFTQVQRREQGPGIEEW